MRHLNVYFFFLLLLLVGVVMFFIFQPFLTAIVAAAILAALFQGTYQRFGRWFGGHTSWSAFFTCLFAVFLIVTPIFLVLSLAVGEANDLYQTMSESSSLENFIGNTLATIQNTPYLNLFVGDGESLNQEKILRDIQNFSQNALGLLQAAYQGVTHFIFWIFIMFFTLFYFLIDGKRAVEYVMQLSPLKNEHDKLLIEKFVSISRATLKGTLVVSVVQGFLGGLMFWVAGVPSPAIWGLIMVIFAIIPMVGTGIVWLPAGLILLLLGDIWQGVFVLAVGFGVISLVDNILRPKLVGRDTQMHPLMVFFATLGGIAFFGLPGFIIGPIIVSLFMALSEIYRIEFRDQLKEYNQ